MNRVSAAVLIVALGVGGYFLAASLRGSPAQLSTGGGAGNTVPATEGKPALGTEEHPAAGTVPGARVIPSKLEPHPDGGMLADAKWRISGEGTRDSPYQVDWDYLMSIGDTYIPRLGETSVPERLAMLQGKWVRVSGYVAFPLVATESDELLCMLNQWDGCCIGIPPTPYDAIEVRLKTAVDSSKRHTIRYGTVTGILRIEPYVVEKWLIGLYLMDDASLITEL